MDNANIFYPSCTIVTEKKHSYYNYTYSIDKVLDQFQKIKDNRIRHQYMKYLGEVADFNTYQNCCNCVALILYKPEKKIGCEPGTGEEKECFFDAYIPNIYFSCVNINKYLPGYLVRFYVDTSVYTYYKNCMKTQGAYCSLTVRLFQEILLMNNVEVHTFDCDPEKVKLANTRSYRFAPMVDDSVNLLVCREADGVVTFQDCFNIEMFEKNGRIFYIVPLNQPEIPNGPYNGYGLWLKSYKYTEKYFDHKNNIIDMAAGVSAFKIKIRKDYFYKCFAHIRNLATNIVEIFKNNNNIVDITKIGERNFNQFKFAVNNNIFDIGFDEIFLLELFKNLISVSYDYDDINKTMNYDKDEMYVVKDIILGNHFDHNIIDADITYIGTTVRVDVSISPFYEDKHENKKILSRTILYPGKTVYFLRNYDVITDKVFTFDLLIDEHIYSNVYYTIKQDICDSINPDYDTYFGNSSFNYQNNTYGFKNYTPSSLAINMPIYPIFFERFKNIYTMTESGIIADDNTNDNNQHASHENKKNFFHKYMKYRNKLQSLQ